VPAEDLRKLELKQRVGRPYRSEDQTLYHVLHVAEGERTGVPQGKYLVDDRGEIRYREDPAINGLLPYDDVEAAKRDRGEQAMPVQRYDAPKTKLMALIIDGILNQKLPWSLVLIGALLAVSLELCAVPSLPFAVGIYLPLQTSFPIFCGGVVRWLVDRLNPSRPEESESSAGVLLSSGYIAGGAIVGVMAAFLNFRDEWLKALNLKPAFDRLFLTTEQVAMLENPAGVAKEQLDLINQHLDFVGMVMIMSAFALMVALLLAVGVKSRFSQRPSPAQSKA
jgi:hypothetical protein